MVCNTQELKLNCGRKWFVSLRLTPVKWQLKDFDRKGKLKNLIMKEFSL